MGWPCPACDRELTTERGMRQHHTKVHGVPLPNRTCKGCGEAFHDTKAGRTYCDDCNPNAGEHNGNWEGGKETATCQLCGGGFRYYPSDKKGLYCPTCVTESDEFLGTPSYELREVGRIDRECEQCGAEMRVLKTDVDRGVGRFCSRECLAEWMSENVVGEDHHQWKGGPLTYGRRWWAIRRQARERDEHTCQNCGSAKGELGREPDVHRIRPVRTYEEPQDAHFMANVICLCRRCHRLVEAARIEPP